VAIVNVDSIGKGMVQDSYGAASFVVKYTAIVLKPFKNEVVDGIVDNVNKVVSMTFLRVNGEFLIDGIFC